VFILNTIFEGEWSFNHTSTASTVYVHSFSPPPHSPSPLHFALNRTQIHGHEPLPSVEGCGLIQQYLNSLRSEDASATALPLSRGMWVAHHCSTEELGREGWKGGTRTKTTTTTTTVHPPPPPPPQRACLLPLPSPEGCGPTIVLDGRMWDRKEDQGGGAEGGRPSRFVTK